MEKLEENEEKIEQCTVTRPVVQSQKKVEYSHFLSIPVGYEEMIRDSYSKVKGRISQLTKIPQEKLTRPSMLHLTLLMLPLYNNKEKIAKVKEVLKELEKELIDNHSEKIYLKFKGISTFAENPAQANNIFFSIVQDKSLKQLESTVSKIIQKFLERNILTKEELSFVKWDSQEEQWKVKFHLTACSN